MTAELQLLWLAVLAYVAGGCTAIVGVVMARRPERTVLTSLLSGLALHTIALALRWARLEHGPFVTMFEILSSNVWSLLLVYVIAYWRLPPIRPTAALVMPVMFVMMAWLLTTDPVGKALPGTFDTLWLYVHVALGKVFLGAVLVAVGIGGVVLLRAFNAPLSAFARLPSDERLDDLAYRFLALALIFDTLMLIAGAIWAQAAWGRYWSWDPLETWAFITWLLLAFTIHLRFTVKASPRLGACLAISVFVVAFLTLFGVPFISEAPHKGVL